MANAREDVFNRMAAASVATDEALGNLRAARDILETTGLETAIDATDALCALLALCTCAEKEVIREVASAWQ